MSFEPSFRAIPLEVSSRLGALQASETRSVIAIDGRGGAGKSTLARLIASSMCNAQHVELDWFHLPHAHVTLTDRLDLRRLREELLVPFVAGQREFTFKRYN